MKIADTVSILGLALVGGGVLYFLWNKQQANASNNAVANADSLLYQSFDEEQEEVALSQALPGYTASAMPETAATSPVQGTGAVATTANTGPALALVNPS